MNRFKYEKKRLSERLWRKFVIWHMSPKTILQHLEKMTGPVMYRNGGDWKIVMIAEETDSVLFMLMADITPEDNRGFGMWGNKKYHCAANNRIVK